MIPDGRYDVVVVDTEAAVDGATASVSVVILDGEWKGRVVDLRRHSSADPIDLLGMPGTLVVTDGEPSLALDNA